MITFSAHYVISLNTNFLAFNFYSKHYVNHVKKPTFILKDCDLLTNGFKLSVTDNFAYSRLSLSILRVIDYV